MSGSARFLKAQGGPATLIQITGGSSRRAMPGRGLWAAGAFGVRALTQAAALELREEEIHVALLIIDAGIDRSGEGDAHTADQPSLADAVAYLASQSPAGDDPRVAGHAGARQPDAVEDDLLSRQCRADSLIKSAASAVARFDERLAIGETALPSRQQRGEPEEGTVSSRDTQVSIGGESAFGTRPGAEGRDLSRALFGQVMGLVALTVGCAALGAYLGRNLSGGVGIGAFILAFGCIFGLQIASARGHEQLAIGFLFGLGVLLGAAVGPVLRVYAETEPAVLWQSAGATGAFVGGLGTLGYATRRDLSSYRRALFFALLALIVFGLIAIFVSIPHANLIYAVLGLVIFGGFTIVDFNRLRRAGNELAVPIAASIFLDVFNVFLFFLQIFGGGRQR